jgi:hypothetical protein
MQVHTQQVTYTDRHHVSRNQTRLQDISETVTTQDLSFSQRWLQRCVEGKVVSVLN